MSYFIDLLLDLIGSDGEFPTNRLIGVVVVALIAAAVYVYVARRRPRVRDPEHMRKVIGTLLALRDQLLNPDVRVPIVDYATGALLLQVPRTGKEWEKLIRFLTIRHGENLQIARQIRFCLTRREKNRLDRIGRQVENRRLKVGRLMAVLQRAAAKSDEVRTRVLMERTFRGIVRHLDSIVEFERRLLFAIDASLEHYSAALEGA